MTYTKIPAPPGTVEVERWLHGETDVLLYFTSRELGEQFIAELEKPEGFSLTELDADDELYSDSTVWDHVPAHADIWTVSARVSPDTHKPEAPRQQRIWEFSGRFAERTGQMPHVQRTKPSRSSSLNHGTWVGSTVTVSGLVLDQCLAVLEHEIVSVQQELNRVYEPVAKTITIWTPREGAELDEGSYLATMAFGFGGEVR